MVENSWSAISDWLGCFWNHSNRSTNQLFFPVPDSRFPIPDSRFRD
ncbi:MAG: hypothetical protein F6K56_08240 [Moorea sp. SIO3G5]|nr:hypothetical protein [Moorena sp. SIO3G5]